MKIVADESRAEATDDNICCDYGREGPVCGPDVHPCQRGEDCAAACSEGAAVDEVGDEVADVVADVVADEVADEVGGGVDDGADGVDVDGVYTKNVQCNPQDMYI